MMKFDITLDSWLPVKTLQGEVKTINLLECLEQAPSIKELDGLNPMEEYSIHRFISVFLMSIFRPERWTDKLDLLEEEKFDMERIYGYIQQCRSEGVSFDLFDEKSPFLQSPYDAKYDREKNLKSPAILDSTRASGNNPIHFDHNLEEEVALSSKEAFWGLMTAQFFCTAMSGGYPSNVYGAPPIFYLPFGKNLFETLILSIPCITENDSGLEIWRSSIEIIPKADVAKTSLIYGMFFPARRIRLLEENGLVKQVYYQPGLHFTGFAGWSDPHVAYRRNKEQALVSIKPSLDREGWRNIGTIAMQFAQDKTGIPEVVLDYAKILEEQDRTQMDIVSYGAVTNNASYYDIQRGILKLDVRIIQSKRKCLWVGEAVNFADNVGSILRKNLMQMIAPADNKRGAGDVQRAVHKYFSVCEGLFYEAVSEIAQYEDETIFQSKMQEWKEIVGKKARSIFDTMQNIYCNSADELIRAEEAYKWLNIGIKKLKEVK